MSDANPFAKLQKLFADDVPAKESGDGKGSYSTPQNNSRTRASQTKGGISRPSHASDDDSALFLQTVNALPQKNSPKKNQEETLFKRAMQSAGIAPMDTPKRKKRGKRVSSPPPHPLPNTGNNGGENAAPQHENAPTTAEAQNHKVVNNTPPSSPASSFEHTFDNSFEEQDAHLFAKAMSDVAPVNKRGRDVHAPADKKSLPHPSGKTPAEIMQDIIDGRIEFALQHTGEYMEGFVQGVSPEVMDKLRSGQLSPEAHIDLHGLNALQAYTELTRFIKNSYQRNIRTMTVITGRGKNSPDGVAVIRNLIQDWLTHDPFKRVVLAFCTAQPRDGGAGALYVLLRKYKKSIGKIQWELPYSGPHAD